MHTYQKEIIAFSHTFLHHVLKAMLPVLVADISDVTERSSIPPPPVLEGCHASTLADPRGDSAEMILPDASSSEMILSCGGTDPWDSDS